MPAGGLLRGTLIAAVEMALALLGARLVFAHGRRGLSLFAPERRAGLWLFGACASALLLRVLSHWALRLVPSTGEAPIEAFIAWPSGALTFALLGMAVPLAEELFFRGFVFGALSGLGRSTACLGTLLLFALAHAQQVWGNWGALLSVTLTGALLTLLRALSGSSLVPAVAHVLFNLSLWRDSFSQ
jgi:membrane protease YdiL (CAAX protease family)